jgi:hypothetical protein
MPERAGQDGCEMAAAARSEAALHDEDQQNGDHGHGQLNGTRLVHIVLPVARIGASTILRLHRDASKSGRKSQEQVGRALASAGDLV